MGMRLKTFAATGRDVADLGKEITGMDLEGVPGRVYVRDGGPYIERHDDDWILTLGNCQYDGELAELEPLLYEWAKAEGVI